MQSLLLSNARIMSSNTSKFFFFGFLKMYLHSMAMAVNLLFFWASLI